MSLVVPESEFSNMLRISNTNIMGDLKVIYALTKIRGIGRRFALLALRKAEINPNKRAGELTTKEIDAVRTIIANPTAFDIPTWFLNRNKDMKTGRNLHLVSNQIAATLREDIERMKKVRQHRGIRHYWGYKVRGQHTKTTGRGIKQDALKQ
ncbi:MAG: hypothetical protein MHM6MM_009230 [Cercozoa sp. M6MM]